MNIEYIYTNGCSYSDGTGLKDYTGDSSKSRYSTFLSNKFNALEINESRGGESNQWIWRKTFEWIATNQDKLDKTLFVIQLTYPVRNEIWFKHKQNNGELSERDQNWWGAQHGHDGYTAWDYNQREHSVDRDELNFDFIPDNEVLSGITCRYILGLQSFFKVNNIKYIFFEGDPGDENLVQGNEGRINKESDIAKFIDFNYFYGEGFLQSAGNRRTPCNHPNEEVHIEWADKLYNFVNKVYK